MRRSGHASGVIIGMLSQPAEQRNGEYALRVAVIERVYDKSSRTKLEHTDWFWLIGHGPAPTLKKGEMICAEVRLRSVHGGPDNAPEQVKLEIVRLVPIGAEPPPPSRPSTRSMPEPKKAQEPW